MSTSTVKFLTALVDRRRKAKERFNGSTCLIFERAPTLRMKERQEYCSFHFEGASLSSACWKFNFRNSIKPSQWCFLCRPSARKFRYLLTHSLPALWTVLMTSQKVEFFARYNRDETWAKFVKQMFVDGCHRSFWLSFSVRERVSTLSSRVKSESDFEIV